MICTKHPHSSEATAKKCYSKHIQRRVDKKLGRVPQDMRYIQIKCNPPEPVQLANVVVYYFFKGGKR